MSGTLRRLSIFAGMMVLAMQVIASNRDATITVTRAQGSPTLTVRYSGAVAAMAELRLNGESFATRSLPSSEADGEVNFTLNVGALLDGPNDVEIRLYDGTGKLVGSKDTTINQNSSDFQVVFLTSPRSGVTVRGPVHLSVGFGKNLQDTYVSYFVDHQFRTMSNVPPFDYLWDTGRVTNGWHELEAWAVPGNSSETFKSKSIRVLVDNPGGHTFRRFPLTARVNPAVVPHPAIKPSPAPKPNPVPTPKATVLKATVPKIAIVQPKPAPVTIPKATIPQAPFTLLAAATDAHVAESSILRTKATAFASPVAFGLRDMRPSIVKPPVIAAPVVSHAVHLPRPIVQTIEVTSAAAHQVIADTPINAVSTLVVSRLVTHIRNTVPTDTPPQAAGLMTALVPSTASMSTISHVTIPRLPEPASPGAAAPVKMSPVPGSKSPILSTTKTSTTFVKVEPGMRLDHRGTFAVVMNGDLVLFDVQPRIDDGVPMSPFRRIVEKEGGVVAWTHATKEVKANADGRSIYLQIGTRVAKIDQRNVDMELAPYIDKGRTIVPLSFVQQCLKVNVEYDKATGHVLITSIK
jgi:hypothetical protein